MDGLQTMRPRMWPMFLILALASGAGIARAEPELTRLFSACAGRYSAMVEHQWLTGVDAGPAAARRDAFADLSAAAQSTSAETVTVMADRVAAKAAQASLLSAATFRKDERAAARAAALIASCDRLLPGA